MLDHNPIPNTVYISASGFPVMYVGEASNANDCTLKKAMYYTLTETFDSERRTLFYTSPENFKERFSPITEYDEERKQYRRRVVLMVLGSRFNTYGMLSKNDHNTALLNEFVSRDYHPVRIASMTRETDFLRYYTDDECKEAWLENLKLRVYGNNDEFIVMSADLVSDDIENEYVKQFFPRNEAGMLALPQRFVTSVQVETEEEHAPDGRVNLKALHNAFAIV